MTAATAAASTTVYIGTYTPPSGKAEGVYVYRIGADGGLSHAQTVPSASPSFLALHPAQGYLYAVNRPPQYLYAVNEVRDGEVSAFAVAPDGTLTALNRESARGVAPCHLSLDPTGRWVLVANYTSGHFAVLPVGDDGRLGPASDVVRESGSGPNPKRQEGPHAHMIAFDPSGRYVLGADLGIDRTLIFRLDSATGTLTPNEAAQPYAAAAPGAGPRHFAFHPGGRFLYVNNELDSTIAAYAFDPATGAATALHALSTLPEGFAGANTTAEIAMHPGGRFVYVSNRGHDSIAAFAIDAATGHLTALGQTPTGGREPRSFAIDPTGTFLLAANQHSDTVVTFHLDGDTGGLTATGQVAQVPTPVCILFR